MDVLECLDGEDDVEGPVVDVGDVLLDGRGLEGSYVGKIRIRLPQRR